MARSWVELPSRPFARITADRLKGVPVTTLWVRHAPTSASIVRRRVRAALIRAGATEDEALDAALIASELVGNAVRHAPALPSGHLLVECRVKDGGYLITVTDGGGVRELTVKQSEAWDTPECSARAFSMATIQQPGVVPMVSELRAPGKCS
jgi:hypothetical protein